MIQENELRIGNLVLYEYHKNKDGLGFQRMTPSLFFALDKLFPIPITEQWLLAFGFEKDLDTKYLYDVYCIELDEDSRIQKSFNWDDGVFFIITKTGESIDDYSFLTVENIFNIHQLQNLYFVHKQKELELETKLINP